MNDTMKLSAAVIGGYVLGRTKKGKAAIGLALWLAGRQAGLRPGALLANAPELGKLATQLKGPAVKAVRRAATATLESRTTALADSLQRRTASLTSRGAAEEPEEEPAEEPAEERAEEGRRAAPRRRRPRAAEKEEAPRGRAAEEEYEEEAYDEGVEEEEEAPRGRAAEEEYEDEEEEEEEAPPPPPTRARRQPAAARSSRPKKAAPVVRRTAKSRREA